MPQRSALPPALPPHPLVLGRRRHPRSTPSKRDMAFEVGAMMGVNVFVAAIALVTIVKLIPHTSYQQRQLQSLEAEVTVLDDRVNTLRQEFVQYFDPQQTQINRRQLSDRLEKGQHKIIFSDSPAQSAKYDELDSGATGEE